MGCGHSPPSAVTQTGERRCKALSPQPTAIPQLTDWTDYLVGLGLAHLAAPPLPPGRVPPKEVGDTRPLPRQ